MFTRLLSLWVTGALLMPLIWVNASSSEDYEDVTPTPDFDYNVTFDYYLYNGTETSNANSELLEILPDTKNQGNTVLTPGHRYYVILAGLMAMKICKQTS